MADVSLKILDAKTGQPFPCWINLSKGTGENLAPVGYPHEFPIAPGTDVGGRVFLDGMAWFATSGECELPGNQGECVLKISRAPGYQWTDHPLSLFSGRLAVRLSLPIPQSGVPEDFISADLRSHSVSAGMALVEAQAGNLQVVQVLASQWLPGDPQKSNLAPLAEGLGLSFGVLKNGCLVSWGTLNIQLDSGSLSLLDCHRHVFPLVIDQSNSLDWTVMDWTAQCHRIRGLTVWADYARDHGHQAEAICAAMEGELDCFEVVDLCEKRPGGLSLWYAMAGAGIFLPLVGASAKDSNRIPIGYLRTIFPLQGGVCFSGEAKLVQQAWVNGIKSGVSSVTRWPFLFTRKIQDGEGFVKITTEVGPLTEPLLLEWVRPNGQVLSTMDLTPSRENQLVSENVTGPMPCRLAARLRKPGGELIAHESFHVDCSQKNGEAPVDLGMTRNLEDRLRDGIRWVAKMAGPQPEREMLYRKELFSKALARWMDPKLN